MNALTPIHDMCSIFIDRDNCTNKGEAGGNNTFVFNFPKQITTTPQSKISVSNFSVPYSWFNITARMGNNTLGYVWTNHDGVTVVDFVIDDGNYSLEDLEKMRNQEFPEQARKV